MTVLLGALRVPVVAAPMAGGVSTPELVAAVGDAGGLGFLAGGYLAVGALAEQVARTQELTAAPFGVNLFVPGPAVDVALDGYAERVRAEAARLGVEPGEPRWDDDGYRAKLDLLLAERPPVASFTFGCPEARDVERLRDAGVQVVVTVTGPDEARLAAAAGAAALCVQGVEAGGHRGVFTDDAADPLGGPGLGLLAALRLVATAVDLPLVAAGGLVRGADVAAVLAAGAVAAQLGTAFLRCPEAGTTPAHRAALLDGRGTVVTRAFTGRPARGLRNRFLDEHSDGAPAAYPQVHHLTRPLRATGDPEVASLWAGQTHALISDEPAGDVVRRLDAELRTALDAASRRWPVR